MADVENRVSSLETKFDMFIAEMRDFKNEMRQQNAMRAAEIARTDAKIEKLREQREKDNAKHEAEMKAIAKQREKDNERHNDDIKELNKKIDDKFENLSSQIHIMSVTTILGFGAIVWAVVSAVK